MSTATDPFPDKQRKQAYLDAFNQGNADARAGKEYVNPFLHGAQIQEDAYWAGWLSGGGKVPPLNARTIP